MAAINTITDNTHPNSYSQYGQDTYLDNAVFHGFKNGIFVDVGAYDGKELNNTLFYEKTYGWTGINIEPHPDIYPQLVVNRPLAINLQYAIDINDHTTVDFVANTGYTCMLSGLAKYYAPVHEARINQENNSHNCKSKHIKIASRRLDSILADNNINHVHLLSVDVEGGEEAVLMSIDLDKVFVDVIIFENNYTSLDNLIKHLRKHGFAIFNRKHDVYLINTKSDFYLNRISRPLPINNIIVPYNNFSKLLTKYDSQSIA